MLNIINPHTVRRVNLKRTFKAVTTQNPPPVIDLDSAPVLTQEEAEEMLGFPIDVYERD